MNTAEAFRLSLLTRLRKVHINFSHLQVIIMIIPEEYFKFQDIYLQNSWMTQTAQSEQQWWVVHDTWWPLGHRSANSAEYCEWAWHASIPRNPPRTEIQSSLQATAGLNVYSLLILEIHFIGGNHIKKESNIDRNKCITSGLSRWVWTMALLMSKMSV